jgi:hypothetical protein
MDKKRFQNVAKAPADTRRFEILQKIATASAQGMRCCKNIKSTAVNQKNKCE